MKIFLIIFSLIYFFSVAKAQNINISQSYDLNLNCIFEKVIFKNQKHNFESFTKDQIERKDIDKLIIISKTPDIFVIKNLSEFLNEIDLEVKISNKDIFLIQAFDKDRKYSESAVYTKKTGELIHEITKNIKLENQVKDISFYKCKNTRKDT